MIRPFAGKRCSFILFDLAFVNLLCLAALPPAVNALNQIIDMFMKMNVVDDASIKRCTIITSNEIKAFEFDDVDFYLFLLPPFSQKNK